MYLELRHLLLLAVAALVLFGPLRDEASSLIDDLEEIGGIEQPAEEREGRTTVIMADTGPATLPSGTTYLERIKDVLNDAYDEGGKVIIQRITPQAGASGNFVGEYSFVSDTSANADDDTARRDAELQDAKAALAQQYPTGAPCPRGRRGQVADPAERGARSPLLESVARIAPELRQGDRVIYLSHGIQNSGIWDGQRVNSDAALRQELRERFLDDLERQGLIEPMRGIEVFVPEPGIAAECARHRVASEVRISQLRQEASHELWQSWETRTGATLRWKRWP